MPADWTRHKYYLAHVSGDYTIARTGPPGNYRYGLWERVHGLGDTGIGWICRGHYETADEAKAAADERARAE